MIVIRNTAEDLEKRLSADFWAHEFRCKCGKCNVTLVSKRLLFYLQALRKLWGNAVVPASAYRCQEYNRTLKGAVAFSWHMSGHAVDLPLPEQSEDRHLLVTYAGMLFPYNYLGDGFIHLDTRGSK